LTQVGGIATVEQAAGFSDLGPALTPSSEDGSQVTIVLVRHPLGGVTYDRIEHAPLRPWSAWPAGGIVSPTYESFTGFGLVPDYRAALGYGDHFALLFASQVGPGLEPRFADMDPNSSSDLSFTWSGVVPVALPVLMARGSAGFHLIGVRDGPSPGLWTIWALRAAVNSMYGVALPLDATLGCATSPIVGAAVPYGAGWLVALSNAAGASKTLGCGDSMPGPPTRIDIVLVGGDGKISFFLGVDAGAPVSAISMAPHPSGAFVVWRADTGGAAVPLRWMRVDVPGAGLVGPGDVAAPALAPAGGFATATLGTNLVVAWGSDPANDPPDIVLSVLDEGGSLLAEGGIKDRFVPPLSLVAAPEGHSVVVAWHEPTSVDGPTAVRLARFDCAGGI
jgi:hypothetical protein